MLAALCSLVMEGVVMMLGVFTKARKQFGTVYPAQPTDYQVELTEGSISIFKDGNFKIAFRIGDQVEYGSYNLSYYGPITKITDKAVTIKDKHSTSIHRLGLYEFCWRNVGFDLAETQAENSTTMMYI